MDDLSADGVLPDLTMIECVYRRAYGGPYSDFFVKIDGRWLAVGGDDCYSHDTWEDVTSGYDSVTVVARPTQPDGPEDGA